MRYKTQLQSVWIVWHNFVLRGCNNWATHPSYRYTTKPLFAITMAFATVCSFAQEKILDNI